MKITKLSENASAQAAILKLDPKATFPEIAPKAPEETTVLAAAKTDAKTTTTVKVPTVKTMGIFQITGKFDPTVLVKGASSQIEICTRDYLSWLLKNKAPKILQIEFDRAHKADAKIEPKDVFEITILKTCKTDADLKAAKTEFGLLPSFANRETTASKIPSKMLIFGVIQANRKFAEELATTDANSAWADVASLLAQAEKILDGLTNQPATQQKVG